MLHRVYSMILKIILTILCVLTTRTANGCTALTVWRPWARSPRPLLRRNCRRLARRRATTVAGSCARVPRTVVWYRPTFSSGSRTRLKRTHNHNSIIIILPFGKTRYDSSNRGIQCGGGHVNHRARTSSTLFYNTILLLLYNCAARPSTTTTTTTTTARVQPRTTYYPTTKSRLV